MYINIVEDGITYNHRVSQEDVLEYIKNNENTMRELNDEQKILKAIYEKRCEDKLFFLIRQCDIPEKSPHYGENSYIIENISPDDIKWGENYYSPTEILNIWRIKEECLSLIRKELEVDDIYIDISGYFCVCIGNDRFCFDNKNFNFVNGMFLSKYRLKNDRLEFIERIQNVIYKNLKIFNDYCNAHKIE